MKNFEHCFSSTKPIKPSNTNSFKENNTWLLQLFLCPQPQKRETVSNQKGSDSTFWLFYESLWDFVPCKDIMAALSHLLSMILIHYRFQFVPLSQNVFEHKLKCCQKGFVWSGYRTHGGHTDRHTQPSTESHLHVHWLESIACQMLCAIRRQ